MTTATELMSDEEKSFRYREMRRSLEPFNQILYRIYTIMPHSGYVIDLASGAIEPLPPPPEWQKQIDKITEIRNEYIKSNFPEFYEH